MNIKRKKEKKSAEGRDTVGLMHSWLYQIFNSTHWNLSNILNFAKSLQFRQTCQKFFFLRLKQDLKKICIKKNYMKTVTYDGFLVCGGSSQIGHTPSVAIFKLQKWFFSSFLFPCKSSL